MTLIDGKKIAADIRGELRERAVAFEERCGKKIGLAVVLVGQDPASQVYVKNKIKGCSEIGIRSFSHYLPDTATQAEVLQLITELAKDENVHGILVQLPLPKHLDAKMLLAAIPPQKDVDGFGAENIGKLALNETSTVACTPLGVMELLKRYDISVKGKCAVVLGRSNIVGRPMAMLLLNADATVTVCHSATENIREECKRADILIAAIGKPKFVTADMVKPDAVVIDVGINRDECGNLCGDVDFEAVRNVASYITPVPGGVGPMTIAMLLSNTVKAAERLFR